HRAARAACRRRPGRSSRRPSPAADRAPRRARSPARARRAPSRRCRARPGCRRRPPRRPRRRARGARRRAGAATRRRRACLHPGHVRYLAAARALGDLLVVGLNGDASVRRLKGPGRPILRAEERAEVLAGLAAVDHVILFDEDTPRALVVALGPDVLVKGADWAEDEIVGRDETLVRGGRVERIPLVPGISTSELLRRIRDT